MRILIRTFKITLAALLILLTPLAVATYAQSYPTRPIRLVIGFPPGGLTDSAARLVAEELTSRLGTPVTVENRGGASGAIAINHVLSSPPDGYTLIGFTPNALAIPFIQTELHRTLLRDGDAVGSILEVPNVLVVKPSFPASTVQAFINHSKINSGKLNIASAGAGTSVDLSSKLFMKRAGLSVEHIEYKGESQAIADVVAGHVDGMFVSITTSRSHIQSGAVRALAVTTTKRSPLFPDVSTIAEVLPGYSMSNWFGISAPKGTPPEALELLNRHLRDMAVDEVVRKRIVAMGAIPVTNTREQFHAFMVSESNNFEAILAQLQRK